MTSSFIRYVLPLIAVASLVFAVFYVTRSGRSEEQSTASPASTEEGKPPTTPYANTLAGAGVVEPQSENISIGTPTPGIVAEVGVVVGQKIKAGDLLFRLDDRQLRGELGTREAALAVAQAQLRKLDNQPRPEEVAVSEAKRAEAVAWEKEGRQQLDRVARLSQTNAMTQSDLDTARRQASVAAAQLTRTEAELTLLKAGAWEFDKLVAQQGIIEAQAEIDRVKTELSRLEVRSPREGEVLKVNVRPGEYAGTPAGEALVIIGSTEFLHVRVDVDEQDIGRFRAGAPGVAMPRGFPDTKYALRFKRIEPYVVPKKSLTGDNTERVDTRVLQVIYEVEKNVPPLFVGQQVDVFLDVDAVPAPAVAAAR